MTLIVYISTIYYAVPYAAEGLQALEMKLVSSGLLPKLCGSLQEVAAVLTPGDNVCRLAESAYNRMVTGISGGLVALAASWGYVKGNIWTTAKMHWNKLTDKFDNMLKSFENHTAIDIVSDGVDMEGKSQAKVESMENAKYLAVLYKNELEEAELDQEIDIGVLHHIAEEYSQDPWPSYEGWAEGEGRHKLSHRRGSRRTRGRGKRKNKHKTRGR